MTSFKIKKVLLRQEDWPHKISDIREEWLTALLSRAGIPKLMIERRQALKLSKEEWSNYLLTSFKLKIIFDIAGSTIMVYKLLDKNGKWEEEKIGEWLSPESVKHKPIAGKPFYDVRLKHWSLI